MTDKDAGLGKWLPTLTIAIPVFILIALVLMLIKMNTDLSERSHINNAYLRTMTCIASRPPTVRTADYVRECYQSGERTNNITIERYGDAREK